MGWSVGYNNGRDIGYGVPAFCDHPKCNEKIDRGFAFLCGEAPYGEYGCGLYFCSKHLRGFRKPRGANHPVSLCSRCTNYRESFDPKPDIREWIKHKLSDDSWALWRKENPKEVEKLTNFNNKYMKNKTKKIRRQIIEMIYQAQTSHIGSCLSCVDILTVLYFSIMRENDIFILSKGHAAAALYATLAEKGVIPKKMLNTYCKKNSNLLGLVSHKISGVPLSTGSLGHGLPVAVGMALADPNRNVYVLLSDGELQEGTTWESAMFASQHKIKNLIAIIDYNNFQAFGRTNEIMNVEPLTDKWRAFGWDVDKINGHCLAQLECYLSQRQWCLTSPRIIIASTIKGKGVSFMEDKLEWHYNNISETNYKKAIFELQN